MSIITSDMEQRLTWVDMERGIAMICVFVWHIGLFRENANFPWYIFFEYFLIPVFFFISGYLFKDRVDNRCDFSRIIKRLLIPYFVLGFVIGIKPTAIQDGGILNGMLLSAKHVVQGRELWFIACLVIVELLAVGIKNLYNVIGKTPLKIAIAVMSMGSYFLLFRGGVILPDYWCWCEALVGIGFFMGGSLYRKYESVLTVNDNKTAYVLFTIYLVLTILCHYVLGCHMNYASLSISNPIVSFFLSWFSLIVLTNLCKFVPANQVIIKIGRSTLFLFAINIWVIKSLASIDCYLSFVPTWIVGILMAMVSILISLFLNEIMKKIAPWSIGE